MKSEMERDILKVLVTEEELKARITEMGAELYEQFHGKNPYSWRTWSGLAR